MQNKNRIWETGYSILAEMDTALTLLNNSKIASKDIFSFLEIQKILPQEWKDKLPNFVGKPGESCEIFEVLSLLCAVEPSEDYNAATLQIRETSRKMAAENLFKLAAAAGINITENEDDPEIFKTVYLELIKIWFSQIGFIPAQNSREIMTLTGTKSRAVHQALRMLKDGDLQNHFWQWMDRFYYQFYLPWRETRKTQMEKQKKQTETCLPAAGNRLSLEQLTWLPNLNPLRLHTNLLENIFKQNLQLFFWIEPFGYVDAWIVDHRRFMISFSQSEELIRDFTEFAQFTALRAKALSDPTRLTILRFIRFFGMTNTEIANLLGITRPTVSVHAKILREAGLIESTSQGREVHHSINPEKVSELFKDLQTFLDLKNIEPEEL